MEKVVDVGRASSSSLISHFPTTNGVKRIRAAFMEDALTRVNWFVCLFLRRGLETFGGVFVIGLVLPCFASLRFVLWGRRWNIRYKAGEEWHRRGSSSSSSSSSSSPSPSLSASFDSYELFNT